MARTSNELTQSEVLTVMSLDQLANSPAGQFLRKVGGVIVNETASMTAFSWGGVFNGTTDGGLTMNASNNSTPGAAIYKATMSNTQTGALTGYYMNTGTSLYDHTYFYLTGTRGSLYFGNSDQAPAVTTNRLYALAGTLYWNGTAVGASTGGSPGGVNTNVQFNDSGAFGGDTTFTFNKTSKLLTAQNLATQSVFLNTSPTITPTVGQFFWNVANGTPSVNVDTVNQVTLDLGLEQWVRVVNKTGAQINDGQAVYISGAQGNRPTAVQARADAIGTAYMIGVATQNIAINAEGFVTTLGEVTYDTSTFAAGDTLYLSAVTAGLIVNVAPSDPNYMVVIGRALNSTNNGRIFVHPEMPIAMSSSLAANSDLVAASQKAVKSYVDAQTLASITSHGATTSTLSTFEGGIIVGKATGTTGNIAFKGTTSGTVNLSVADASGTWTLKLPTSGGTNGYLLQTDGAGNTSWVVAPATGVTSVSAGNGMNFTTITTTGPVTLGTPSTCTAATSNAVTTNSHTHQITGFLTAESDTLATVTGRGATTATASVFEGNITVGKATGSTGAVIFKGTTSGTVTLSTLDAAGTWTLKLPATGGTNLYFLQTDGSGNTTWASALTAAVTSVSAGNGMNFTTITGTGTVTMGTPSTCTNATTNSTTTNSHTHAITGFLTAESDTLATVTGRGATTGTASTFEGNITVGKAASTTGNVAFKGTTSGTVTLSVLDAAGTWTMKLPGTAGTNLYFLQTDGSGNTTWAAALTAAVTSVSAGNGMNFTTITGTGSVNLGTPSTCTNATSNAVTSNSHTHAITGFLTAESDTLATVTGRGATTATASVFEGNITVGKATGSTGAVILKGTTSGTVTLSVLDAAGTWTMKLPSSGGTNGYVLQTDGSGNTSWVSPPAAGVTSVAAGNGMNFTTITTTGSVTLGTPSTCTAATSNAVTTNSHTHAITGFLTAEADTLATVTGRGATTSSASTFEGNITVGKATGSTGNIAFKGTTSGTVNLTIPDSSSTWIMKLPSDGGTVGYFLQTDGNGTCTWAPATATLAWGTSVSGNSSTGLNMTITANAAANTKGISISASATQSNPVTLSYLSTGAPYSFASVINISGNAYGLSFTGTPGEHNLKLIDTSPFVCNDSTVDRTSSLFNFDYQRTFTSSGARLDDYEMFRINRKDASNGASSSVSARGTVLTVRNYGVQTLGTLQDLVTVLKIENIGGTGAHLNIAKNTSMATPTTEGDFGYNGTNLYFKPSGTVVDILDGVVDTLAKVTGRGSTTTTASTFAGNLTVGAVAGSTGNVAFIGTTSGTVNLSVNDVAGSWTMKLPASAGTNGYFLKTDGSGNTSWAAAGGGSPGGADTNVQYNSSGSFAGSSDLTWDNTGKLLNVNGNLNIPTTTSGVGQIKQNSSTILHTYGTDNFFMGIGAGNYTTTGTGLNMGIGKNCFSAITSGYSNVAIGANSCPSVSTGFYNIGIGSNTLFSATTTRYNVAIGDSALYNVTTSGIQYSVAIGYSSLKNITSNGNSNVGIGYFSGLAITKGGANICLGPNSGTISNSIEGFRQNYTGNVFIGSQAAYTSIEVTLGITVNAGGSVDTGVHYYHVSYVLDGKETTTSVTKNIATTTAGDNSVAITGISVYSGPLNCTARKLYRTKVGDVVSTYLVTTISDNTTTTYTDNAADSTLSTASTAMQYSVIVNGKSYWSNTMVVGASSSTPVYDSYWGCGIVDTAPADFTFNGTTGSGSNIAGASLSFCGGRGTGTGAGGSLKFRCSPVGSSGTAANALEDRMIVSSSATKITQFYSGGVERAYVDINGNFYTV